MKYLFTLILCLLAIVFYGQGWRPVSYIKSSGKKWSYHGGQIVKADSVYECNIKFHVDNRKLKAYRNGLIKNLITGKLPAAGYKNYSYSIYRLVVDCKNKKYRILDFSNFTKRGKLLGVFSSDSKMIEDIPDHAGESII